MNFIFFFLGFLFFISCSNHTDNEMKCIDNHVFKKISDNNIFNIEYLSIINNQDVILKGIVYKKNDWYYSKIIQPIEIKEFKLFPLKSFKDTIYVKWETKENVVLKEYQIFIKDVFFDNNINDSVFKICFINYGVISQNEDVYIFFNNKEGVLGLYFGYQNIEDSVFFVGNNYGNIYKKKYGYRNYVFNNTIK